MEKKFVIGITGGSGSGKTSLIRNIKNSFHPEKVCVISQDDYYRPIAEQVLDENGVQNFDLPTAIDSDQLLADLKSLMNGETLEREEYGFHSSIDDDDVKEIKKQVKKITLLPAKVIVVEGLFVFHYEAIRALFDFSVFVDTKANLKLIRRIKRDNTERHLPLDDVLYRYEKHVLPSYEKYIKPYKSATDIIINNHKNYEKGLELLLLLIKSKL